MIIITAANAVEVMYVTGNFRTCYCAVYTFVVCAHLMAILGEPGLCSHHLSFGFLVSHAHTVV